MRAHLFNDGGGMVTGTSDVEAARAAIRSEWLGSAGWESEAEIPADDRAGWDFWSQEPIVERGRTVPTPQSDDHAWAWLPGGAPGARGMTTAVVWYPKPLAKLRLRSELLAEIRQATHSRDSSAHWIAFHRPPQWQIDQARELAGVFAARQLSALSSFWSMCGPEAGNTQAVGTHVLELAHRLACERP